MTATVEAKPKTCITGAAPEDLFKIPFVFGDFQEAPDLKEIGDELIERYDEFERLRWAMRDEGVTILYLWRKKASKNADRVKAGTLQKSAGLIKFLSHSRYVVQIAADANFGATNLQMEALVYHELYHIKMEVKIVGKGEDAVSVPDPKVRAHDLEMFLPEVERYGLWRGDLIRAQKTFEQAPLFGNG